MKTQHWTALIFLTLWSAHAAYAAQMTVEGRRLVISGTLDNSTAQSFIDTLRRGRMRTVVFESSQGGTPEAATLYAQAIRAANVNTEIIGQCHAACAYAFLAGKQRHFGAGLQVNSLLIPMGMRPKPGELAERWRNQEEAQRTLARFSTDASAASATPDADATPPKESPKEQWRPDQGVLFTATLTLFGRIHNTYYCDGTQGRDFSRCELLSDADPFKLGVLTP